MKPLDRISLIDRIGRELQSRMTYAEIDTYLKAHGVDVKKPTTPGMNSKWVYTKELLGDEKDGVILKIAEELEVPHNYAVADADRALQATFWDASRFRLFLSHLSSFKKTTGLLQAALRAYGISAFVAHVDIEPTREWQDEIEAGLFSMDALAAILMPGFKESSWTDQEVGIAVGRGVLVIPVMRGLEPYGFISKYQGLNANGKSVSEVADAIFRILVGSPKTRTRMLSCLVDSTAQASSEEDAVLMLQHVTSVKDLPSSYLQKLRDAASASSILSKGKALERLNALLAKHKLQPVGNQKPRTGFEEFDDDIPF
jgi:hypothetical protein